MSNVKIIVIFQQIQLLLCIHLKKVSNYDSYCIPKSSHNSFEELSIGLKLSVCHEYLANSMLFLSLIDIRDLFIDHFNPVTLCLSNYGYDE